MKLCLVALLLGVALASEAESWKDASLEALPTDVDAAFADWKAFYGKSYEFPAREVAARETFEENWKFVVDHNKQYRAGSLTWHVAMNKFADLTEEQFAEDMTCLDGRRRTGAQVESMSFAEVDLPSAVDWTNVDNKSYVSEVKDQGQCGSCWAFSTTGATESLWAIDQGWTGSEIVLLSEQQLVDCTYAVRKGCNGGLMEDGFDYIQKDNGLCTESEYPYTAKNGNCQASTCGKKYDAVSGYSAVAKSTNGLMSAIATTPTSVSVDASSHWQLYKGGILTANCGTSLDHGVLGVGYGTDNGEDFWKIKNSWGPDWGEDGYIRLCRNCGHKDGECGCLLDNDYPLM